MNSKKIISFCAYGKNPKYVHSALKNVELQKKVYPDWTCRIYVSENIPDDAMKLLEESQAEVVIRKPVQGHLGMFWRFEPLMDKDIERFIVRDTDSRLNEREASAVNEWIEDGSEFHIIRDHEQHAAPIVGGLWGASHEFISKFEGEYEKLKESFLKSYVPPIALHPRGPYFNYDQPFLWQHVWPRVRNTHLAHINGKYQKLRFTGRERYLTIELPNNGFCGQDLEYEQ